MALFLAGVISIFLFYFYFYYYYYYYYYCSTLQHNKGLQLTITYPDASNRSFVELTCLIADALNSPVNDAKFERDNQLITTNSELVNIIQTSESMISFSFTQDQEGWFRCTTSEAVDTSNAIALAGELFKKIMYIFLLFYHQVCCHNYACEVLSIHDICLGL